MSVKLVMVLAVTALAVSFGTASCSSAPKSQASAEPVKKYQLKGQVTGVDAANHTAKINGEKVEGWMEPMTMDYPVKDDTEFKKLAAGQSITATVYVQGTEYWIGDIGVAPAPEKK